MENTVVRHAERLASTVGGFVSISAIFVVSQWFLEPDESVLLVASMAASAVLLFAVPHGKLSQPWPLFGGHILSAIIGVTCAQVIPNEILAASTAVGLAIGVMYYLNCVHPPGGATALVAVIGGDGIHSMGYTFVITPILFNICIMFVVAVLYNYLFAWRRYPMSLHSRVSKEISLPVSANQSEISHADFVYALSEIDSFVDVSEFDLLKIYDLATKQSTSRQLPIDNIKLASYYSNGEYGDGWSVRHIVDESPSNDPEKDIIIYKVVAGFKRRTSAATTRLEFSRWAKHEVMRDEDNWKKVISS